MYINYTFIEAIIGYILDYCYDSSIAGYHLNRIAINLNL